MDKDKASVRAALELRTKGLLIFPMADDELH